MSTRTGRRGVAAPGRQLAVSLSGATLAAIETLAGQLNMSQSAVARTAVEIGLPDVAARVRAARRAPDAAAISAAADAADVARGGRSILNPALAPGADADGLRATAAATDAAADRLRRRADRATDADGARRLRAAADRATAEAAAARATADRIDAADADR